MKVMFSNVDVYTVDKRRELVNRLSVGRKPDVIAIQEVRPKNSRYERDMVEYEIEGYDIYDRNVIGTDVGRGLLLYVDESLKTRVSTLGVFLV